MEKVFGLGFSKSGTTSLETSLETLGYKVCRGHWQNSYTFYLQALWIHRDYNEIFRLVNYWDAFADTPWGGTTLYEELYERLPDSKFILTVRDDEEWYNSLEKLLTMFDLNLETAFDSYHSNGMYGSHYFFSHVFGIDTLAGNKQKIIDHYHNYNLAVIDFFAKRNVELLVMDFAKGDGWEKLCPFLGKPIPPIPFPHQNQSVQNPYLSNKKAAHKRSLIVNLHSGHPNDFESARYMRRNLANFGYELVEVALSDQQAAQTTLNDILRTRNDEMFCFLSDNYYALQVSNGQGALLHEMTGIPLVIMQHDHPLHFIPQQTPKLAGTITFVQGEDSRGFIADHYPAKTITIANTGSLPPIEPEIPDFAQFEGRENAILAPMNLNFGAVTLDVAWAQIKSLPGERRTLATALAEAALTDCSTPLHVIAAGLPHGLLGEEARAAVSDQLLVLTFVKLWRRHQMVRTLIELPILWSSETVPADLQFKYPEKFTLLSMAETVARYREYRFTLNSHPLLSDLLHDRVLMATALNSVCITDVNTAVQRYFKNGVDAIFFDYSQLSEMPKKIAGYLEDPRRAFELTVQAAAVRDATESFGYRKGYANLLEAIAAHWAPETRVEPVLTPA